MLSLRSCCRSVCRSLGRKTQTNHLEYRFSILLFRRAYFKALNELTNLDNIDGIEKIMYNDVLAKHGILTSQRRNRQDEYCEPICLKYLKNDDNNNLIQKSETDIKEQKKSDLLNFPYGTTKSYTLSNKNSLGTDVFSKSVRYLTPSDNEKVTLPTYRSSNFEELAKNFDNSLKTMQMIEPECENDNISFEVKFGTSDPNIPISSVPCGGCGAMLHCTDPSIPGFLPKEIFSGLGEKELRSEICRRCYFLKEFDVALGVNVSSEEYPKIISHIKKEKALVILMIDILDFPCSIWPGISDLIGSFQPVIVVANKVDLLIQEEKKFQSHLKKCVLKALAKSEMNLKNVKDVVFISAKTGYGVENLITSIFNNWSRSDVYIVGCTNVGKSTLFNTLIHSDLCKEKATVSLLKATISAWPGTTLNLLKFPIPKPTPRFLFYRSQRLIEDGKEQKAFEKVKDDFLKLVGKKQTPLAGHVTQTFSYKPDEHTPHDMIIDSSSLDEDRPKGLDPNEFEGKWCFDTPGVVNPDQIVNILTTSELLLTMPKSLLIPRNFRLKEGTSLFIGGLARLDYVAGNDFAWFTVYASKELPVTVTQTKDADLVYKKLLGSPLFRVPFGEEVRLSKWPELSCKTFDVCGKFRGEAIADIVLSSVGWVSVTVNVANRCKVTAWTPEGRGLYVRDAIIRNGSFYRGRKIGRTPAFETAVEVVEDISVSKEPSEILSRSP